MSKIEWTEKTWNPIVGCSKVSAGCKNCYAIRMAWRLQHIGHSAQKYAGTVEKTAGGQLNWTGKVNIIESELLKPLKWRKPKMIFVNSESDLFHESIPFDVINKVFAIMGTEQCKYHTFQILTKRPQRMLEYFNWLNEQTKNYSARKYREIGIEHDRICNYLQSYMDGLYPHFQKENTLVMKRWPFKNVWLGVSVENHQTANERIPLLLQVPAAVRFLSCEPLLGPVDLKNIQGPVNRYQVLEPITNCGDSNRPGIDWVIVGGESGKGARPMYPDWIRSLRDQCTKTGTAFFFKQYGAYVDVNNILPVPMGDFSKNLKSGKWVGVDNTGAIVDHVSGPNNAILMAKVGKKEAGRMLDGREWNEFPVSGKHNTDPDLATGGFDY